MTIEQAEQKLSEGPERAQVLKMDLVSHVNAAPGGTSVLHKRDEYHSLNEVTRTPKRKNGSYGRGRTEWYFDGEDEEPMTSWGNVVKRIARRIEGGHYSEA